MQFLSKEKQFMSENVSRSSGSSSSFSTLKLAVRNGDGTYTLEGATVPASEIEEATDGKILWRGQRFSLRSTTTTESESISKQTSWSTGQSHSKGQTETDNES